MRQVDGHGIPELIDAFNWAAGVKSQPAMIIAKTVKGKGVSFMEDVAGWHGNAPDAKQAAQALDEIGIIDV